MKTIWFIASPSGINSLLLVERFCQRFAESLPEGRTQLIKQGRKYLNPGTKAHASGHLIDGFGTRQVSWPQLNSSVRSGYVLQ